MNTTPPSPLPLVQALSQGQALDAMCKALLLQAGALVAAVPEQELSVAKRRALYLESNSIFGASSPSLPGHQRDLRLALPGRDLPARLYEPEQTSSDVLMVYFHGGGWVIGGLQTHDESCRFLSHHLGMKLLSVQYRKAPEHVFPAPCDDAIQALAWAAAHQSELGCRRLAVGGDSAGGHLAAVAMHAASHGEITAPIAGALLFYPVTDMRFDNTSYRERGDGPGLTSAAMMWYWQQFLNPHQPLNPQQIPSDARAVPMQQNWQQPPPPTVVTAAWHDPLCDEAITYAQRLAHAGGRVTAHSAPDLAHGYLRQVFTTPSARAHVLASVQTLKQWLN